MCIKEIKNITAQDHKTVSLINSQIDLLRSQTALIKCNALFPILEIAKGLFRLEEEEENRG